MYTTCILRNVLKTEREMCMIIEKLPWEDYGITLNKSWV